MSKSWTYLLLLLMMMMMMTMMLLSFWFLFYSKNFPLEFGQNQVSNMLLLLLLFILLLFMFCCYCCCWFQKPTFKVWLKLGQEKLRYWWHWVWCEWWRWCKVIFVSNPTFELICGWVGVVTMKKEALQQLSKVLFFKATVVQGEFCPTDIFQADICLSCFLSKE